MPPFQNPPLSLAQDLRGAFNKCIFWSKFPKNVKNRQKMTFSPTKIIEKVDFSTMYQNYHSAHPENPEKVDFSL